MAPFCVGCAAPSSGSVKRDQPSPGVDPVSISGGGPLTEAQAQALEKKMRASSDFPIVINSVVLKEINAVLKDSGLRAEMREVLKRYRSQESWLVELCEKYQVAREILAVPVVESHYVSVPAKSKSGSAGQWQMIASTARVMGLAVKDGVDERLNPRLEAGAALRLLQASQSQLNDWLLSILAYNVGDDAVKKAMKAHGTRDAWVLVKSGIEYDKGYLARVLAAVVLLRNPELSEGR